MKNAITQKFNAFSLIRFALPSMVMMLFMSLYTIIDGVFISQFLGTDALSSANIVYPAANLLIAIGVMLATGGSALIAKKIGENRLEDARGSFSLIVYSGITLGILACILGNIFITSIVTKLGATPILLENCISYLRILLFFAPACVLQLIFQSLFVTAGKPLYGLILTILAGLTNAVLDYVFIVPLDMGIAGAALATGIGQTIPALFGVLYFTFVRKELFLTKPDRHLRSLGEACVNGSSEMVTNLSTAIVTFLFNRIMLKLLGETGVAAITIVLYGQFLFNALFLGFSIGVAPIFSYNYGSQNHILLKKIYKICLRFIAITSIVITISALILTPFLVKIFVNPGSDTFEIAKHGFFIFSFNYFFAGINIFASALFTALSNGKISALLSFVRTFLFIVVSLLILPELLGVEGVWLAIPFAEFFALFVSIYFFYAKKNTYQYA